MAHILSLVGLPLILLVALAVMAGVRPHIVLGPFLTLVAHITGALFNLLSITIKAASSRTPVISAVSKPKPRTRQRIYSEGERP